MQPVYFITGTDTGAGKTVLTTLLIHFLRQNAVKVGAFKPLCSGGREDAETLHAALAGALTLDEINPWHFRAPLAPVLAAKRERKSVTLAEVRAHIRTQQKAFEVTLVEGAGGLLSPLGVDFDSRDLLLALKAAPIIVAANKLGAVNHILLTLEALPETARRRARVVLVSPSKPDAATATNAGLLAQFMPVETILKLPWLGGNYSAAQVATEPAVKRVLKKLVV